MRQETGNPAMSTLNDAGMGQSRPCAAFRRDAGMGVPGRGDVNRE